MTNDKAQIIIGNIPIKPEVLDDCYDITEYQEAKAMAIQALAQTRWIPCSERQPNKCGFYLVSTTDCISIMEYVGEWRSMNIGSCDFYVKAWRELPQPYKVESENNK